MTLAGQRCVPTCVGRRLELGGVCQHFGGLWLDWRGSSRAGGGQQATVCRETVRQEVPGKPAKPSDRLAKSKERLQDPRHWHRGPVAPLQLTHLRSLLAVLAPS